MIASAGSASSTEFSTIAPTESTTVSRVMTAMGTPYCTARLIVPTSRVTRVTRSPVLAPSTRLSGSRRIVSTTYSRMDASRFWPNSVEVTWPANVKTACATTTATISNASEPMPTAGPGALTRSISWPRRRGTVSAATAAMALSTIRATNDPRLVRTSAVTKRTTARSSATGQPRAGLRDSLYTRSARSRRTRCRSRSPSTRARGDACSGGGLSSGGRAAAGVRSDRQVAAEVARRSDMAVLHGADDDLAVRRLGGHELLVRALGDDPPAGEQHHVVGVVQPQWRDGGDHRGATAPVGRDALGDGCLGVRVHGGSRLDEHQDGRVDGESSGKDDPLTLTTGQAAAALVQLARPATGERVVDVLGGRGAQHALGLLTRQRAVRIDGLLQRAGEELAAGVADQDRASYLLQRNAAEV